MNDGDNPECSDTDNLPRDNGITETVQEIVSDSEMNQTNIYCQHCPSLILTALKGRILEKECFLPFMRQKPAADAQDGETLKDYWLVDDIFVFENVGFSKPVGDVKYLICADCEMGPIGWHSIHDKTAIYVAMDRVKY